MEGRLRGRVAVVTGAGSGIGRATAMRLAAEGAVVVVNDIDPSTAEATASDITRAGGMSTAHSGDVTDSAYVDSLVATAARAYGRLDVMHNNAAYGRPGTVAGTGDALLEEMLRVNVMSVQNGIRAALGVMVGQGGGSIVNTASTAAFAHAADRAAYGAAKSAVVALTRSAAVENARHGVRVNAVCPGPIETPAFVRFAPDIDFYRAQLPMRRLGRPEEIAAAVAFLASDDASYVSGVALLVDGAMTARLAAPALRPEEVAG
jgi:meso-butanediol dehydrogenase / (S,S)-butanediol dehydrogenase / diacetyl reductase